jgi:hypothetical protein
MSLWLRLPKGNNMARFAHGRQLGRIRRAPSSPFFTFNTNLQAQVYLVATTAFLSSSISVLKFLLFISPSIELLYAIDLAVNV